MACGLDIFIFFTLPSDTYPMWSLEHIRYGLMHRSRCRANVRTVGALPLPVIIDLYVDSAHFIDIIVNIYLHSNGLLDSSHAQLFSCNCLQNFLITLRFAGQRQNYSSIPRSVPSGDSHNVRTGSS